MLSGEGEGLGLALPGDPAAQEQGRQRGRASVAPGPCSLRWDVRLLGTRDCARLTVRKGPEELTSGSSESR